MNWQPTASINVLHSRARLNRRIREFFFCRDVLEVETPLLCETTATDPYVRSFAVSTGQHVCYLQTSPEFSMKRLLAAGSGPIYQLCKAFRREDTGRLHNPEFTILEWYRPGWTLDQLIEEVENLVLDVAAEFGATFQPFPRFTYAQVFQKVLGLNPHICRDEDLLAVAKNNIDGDFDSLDRNGLLDLLMSHLVEPSLPDSGAFVLEFPASQSALSCKKQLPDGAWVAQRAELYIGGMEIANGYQELVDPEEQAERFHCDILRRRVAGFDEIPFPEDLVEALKSGIPESAGVALGVDRIFMAVVGISQIKSAMAF